MFFCPHIFVFEARLKPIAASATLVEKSTTLEYLPCLCIHEHTVNPKRFHFLAAQMLELTERRCKGCNCVAAVHRISPILARQGPNQLHMRLCHDLVEFLRAWCVLRRLQWGARRQRKSAEVLNDSKGI